MLISNQFRSVATQNKENGDKRVKKSDVKRLEGSNINEVKTAQTVNRLPQMKNEFPHLLVEEEQMQKKKIDIIKKRAEGKKNDSTDVETAEEKNVSTNEVCTFIFFSLFLFICAILQLGIEQSYQANHSIRNWVSNGTFHSDVRGSINLYQLQNPTEYYEWLLNFVENDLYHSDEIGDTKVPQYRKNGVPDNNILISPIRITQRMIKTVPNMNSYTNDTTRYHEIAEKWISIDQSFGSFDDYNFHIEKNDTVTKTNKGQTYEHFYKKEGSFMELGGYVENIHIHSQSKDEAVQKISDIKNSQYINKNTKHLVTDMMFYNSYSDIYTILIIQTFFKPNGQIDSNDIIFMNIKGAYYNMSNGTMVFRAICEFLFVIILCLYVLQEVNQISKKILQQFEKQMKEEARISLQKKEKDEKDEKAIVQMQNDFMDINKDTEQSNKIEQEFDIDGKIIHRHFMGSKEVSQTKQKFAKRLIKLVKLIPLGLKDHFVDIWNMMDVIIFSLAMYIVPLWIYIIVKHSNNFVQNSAQDYNNASQSDLIMVQETITSESSEFLAQNIINASQNIEVYKIGYYLSLYANFGGILICFVIIKFLNYIEKFKKGIGMLFEIMFVASNEIQYFAIIMVFVFIAFIQSFKTAFGGHFIQFSTNRKTFFSLWKFLLKDQQNTNIILNPESGSNFIGNFCIIIFIFLTQFILNNMIRSIITFSYYKVASMQNNELTLEQKLAEKHIFNQLFDEVPNTEKAQELLNENNSMLGIRGKAASFASEIIQQRMNMKSMKENIQKDERRVWNKLADIQKERCMLEQKVLEKNKQNFQQQIRQTTFINPKERQSALMNALGKVQKLTEMEERQIDQETRISKGLRFMQRPTFKSEFQDPIIDRVPSCIQFPIKNLVIQRKNIHKKKNETIQQEDEEESDAQEKNVSREEEKQAERQMQEIIEIQEKERSRYILERMDWDKNFGDADARLIDEMKGGKPSMMTEIQESQQEKIQLKRCGRILWTSIIFGFYMMLVIIVITLQVYSKYQYKVNSSIDNFIEEQHVYKTVGNISDLIFYNTTTEKMSNLGSWSDLIGDTQNIYEKETDSKLLEYISLRTLKGRKDTMKFFQYILPNIGKNHEISSAFDFKNFPKNKTNFLGYFVNDRNYIVGDSFKFSFKLNEKNKNFVKEMDRLVNNSTYKDLYFDKEKENIYRNDSNQPIQEQNNQEVLKKNGIEVSWYKSLIAIPQYLKPSSEYDKGLNYTIFCQDFVGRKSGFNYKCDQHQRQFEMYVNMTISPSEAIQSKQNQINSQVSNFSQMDYAQAVEILIGDGFFDEHLNSIDISFVSYEGYYDMHCYTKISFNFNIAGEVISGIRTKSLRLDILQGTSDYISLGCYLVYYILYIHIFYTFIIGMIEKYMNYRKWEKFEIDYLSETEKKQRHKKKPEFVRIYDVMFDNFTIVNMLYQLLTLISFIKFVQFVLKCKNLQTQPYPILPIINGEDKKDEAEQVRFIEIQTFEKNLLIMIDEFYVYRTYISISVLAVTFKLFEYFFQSKSMMKLLNVMTSIKTELTNFLIIFFCLIFAFVLLSFLSFGTFIEEFSSLTKAFICIFEISISLPISYQFQTETDKHSPMLTLFLFLPMTIIFMFIFSNIFLAIMMNSYEMNIGRWRTQENAEENSEDMNLLKSLLCCTIPKEGTNSSTKNKGNQWQSKKEDDVLGIEQIPMMWKKPKKRDIEDLQHDNMKNWKSQLVQIVQVPEFMAIEFNPYDPNSKYNEEDHLTGLDHLEIDMQMSNIPIKLWTQKIAEEIYQELIFRTKVRNKAKSLLEKKFEFLQMSRNQQKANTFDEFSFQQKRIEYWNYIRCTSQLTSFQLKAINQINKFKQNQVKSLSDKYQIQQRNQGYLYLKVMEIEAPIEEQLTLNMDLGFFVHFLDEQNKLLQNKINSRNFIGYNLREQINISIIKSKNSEEDSDKDKLYEQNLPIEIGDSDAENEDSEFQQNKVNLGGVIGQVDMNILKNLMEPIRDEFRKNLHQFPLDLPIEAPIKEQFDNLSFQKSPLEDNSQLTDNEHDQSDIKLNIDISRKSLFKQNKRSKS